jgi:hypothetical protein
MKRRRLLAAAAALPVVRLARAASGPTIDVKRLGAYGDGRMSDLATVREAIQTAARRPGSTVLFPRGQYFLGTASDSYLVSAKGLRDVRIVGEDATIACRSVNGTSTMLELEGCRNVTVEGLAFRDHGLKRDVNWLGAAAIRLSNARSAGCQDITIAHCSFDSVLGAVVSRYTEDDPELRTRGIELSDLTVRRSYYGFNFQDNGDDLVARRIRCDDVKRSYFPYGVSNHDVELDTANNATGFTDVLIKCFHRDTARIMVRVRCRGKRGGDAILALDNQHERGRGTIRGIDAWLDVDDADCKLDRVVLISSLDRDGRIQKHTTNRWDDIALDGNVRICDQTKLIDIMSVAATPGTLRIGAALARNPRLPASFPGFRATVARAS